MKNIIKIAVAAQILAVSAIHAQTTPSFASFKEAFEAGLTETRVTKNYDQALSNFKAAIDLAQSPAQKSDAMMYVALTQFNLKDFKNAQVDGEKVLQFEGAAPAAVSGTALMLARVAMNADKDPAKAKTLCEKVISLNANASHAADAKLILANAQTQLGQKPEAIATLQSVIDDAKAPEPIKENAKKQLEKLNQ